MDSKETFSALDINETTLPIITQIMDGIPGGFFIYHADNDEKIIQINRAMLRIFGCDTEEEFRELTGFTFPGLVHPDDIDAVERSIQQQISSNAYDLDYVEYRIIQKNGVVRWVEDYGHFVHTESYGDVFYVFIEDATERLRKRMDELEEINQELRRAYDREHQYKKAILYDAVTFFEINLTKDEFITAAAQIVNGQAHDLFDFLGIPHFQQYSEYIRYWETHIEEEHLSDYRSFFNIQRLASCYEEGALEQTLECWGTDVFGRRRLNKYVVLLGKNETSGDIIALSMTKDITAQAEKQKMLQTALRQANAANVARSTFLSNISHDMRTPLNSIIGFTELIQENLYDQQKLLRYVQKIRLSSEQLLSLVTDSMELTRLESGKLALEEAECNLVDLIVEVEKRVLPEAHAKNIALMINKSGVRRFDIIADASRIQEILGQLLDNAIKYTLPGGKVVLSVRETDFSLSEYAKYAFSVEDNGIGIGETFLSRIFDPFARENNTTASGILGSGLGLAVVKSLVDMMSGEITVKSVQGQGSCFTVTLPIRLSQEPPTHPETALPPVKLEKLKGKKVLLVEDNEINMELTEELLTGSGFIVETASNGHEAVEKIQEKGPGAFDIVLMDIQMPVMDGYEATKAIRALDDPRLSRIPIVAVSANAFSEDKSKSLAAGMNAHFPKPIDIVGLRELIGRVLKCV